MRGVLRIALFSSRKFATKPELHGRGIIRAYKIYIEYLSKLTFLKIGLYHYCFANKALYLFSLVKNLISIGKDKNSVPLIGENK